jgi:hypothetical protein
LSNKSKRFGSGLSSIAVGGSWSGLESEAAPGRGDEKEFEKFKEAKEAALGTSHSSVGRAVFA